MKEEKGVIKSILSPFIDALDKALTALFPAKSVKPAEHLLNAKIEFLKAVRGLIDEKIKSLEEAREKLVKEEQTVRREKVEVE